MSYPNSALPAWQLAMIAVVMVVALAAWLLLVYSAAREPRKSDVHPRAESEIRSRAGSESATVPRPEKPAEPERETVT